ncbi:MAG: TraR/DksA family transcriptional regulator [Actinomycetota bacterium]
MDPTEVRAVLERARDELRSELETMTAAPRDPMGAVSFGKRVGEGTSQAVERIAQVDAAKRLDAKLRDVERALAKLDEGTYGSCDVCGSPIGDARLDAIPWAVRCIDHASKSP